MTDELLLGLDVGTTSAKAAVVTREGREVAHGRAPMPWRPVPGGAEIDPAALLDAAREAAVRALASAPEGRVVALGVASMAETGVLLDSAGRPVAPAIAWHDARGEAEAATLRDELGARRFSATTGLAPRPLCTVVKLRWMRDHWPETAHAVRWLNVGEWIVRGLGGEQVAELSLASRTGLLDVGRRAPWAEALAWARAPADLLPALAPAGTPAGRVAPGRLPRAAGAGLAVAGHDHLSAAVGSGATGVGDVLDSCGTAEAFVQAVEPVEDPERIADAVAVGVNVGWHAVEGVQALLASVRSGAVLERVLALLGVDPAERAPLEEAALAAPADAGGLELGGLTGETLTLSGIGRTPSPALAYRAALEAVGAAGAELLAHMAEVGGPARRLVVTGGWAEGVAARAVKARHLGAFAHSSAVFTGARGAAVTAARGAGLEVEDPAPVPALVGKEEV
jgi:sugar (pentulose or hexulose) kinase